MLTSFRLASLVVFLSFVLLFQTVTFGNSYALPDVAGKIPGWIKNNADWWAQGLITDRDFAAGLGYMVKERIIKVDNVDLDPQGQIVISDNLKIPDWIQNNARWWADGAISDDDFKSGIQHMLKEDIITFKEKKRIVSESKIDSKILKEIFAVSKWNQVALRNALEIKNFEIKELKEGTRIAWDDYSNSYDKTILDYAVNLENSLDEAEKQSKVILQSLKKTQSHINQIQILAKDNGISILVLEDFVKEQDDKIENIRNIKIKDDVKSVHKEVLLAQKNLHKVTQNIMKDGLVQKINDNNELDDNTKTNLKNQIENDMVDIDMQPFFTENDMADIDMQPFFTENDASGIMDDSLSPSIFVPVARDYPERGLQFTSVDLNGVSIVISTLRYFSVSDIDAEPLIREKSELLRTTCSVFNSETNELISEDITITTISLSFFDAIRQALFIENFEAAMDEAVLCIMLSENSSNKLAINEDLSEPFTTDLPGPFFTEDETQTDVMTGDNTISSDDTETSTQEDDSTTSTQDDDSSSGGIAVLEISGVYYPKVQFWVMTYEYGCDGMPHYQTEYGIVWSVDLASLSPGQNTGGDIECGFGAVEDIPTWYVQITPQQIDLFKQQTGLNP